MMIALRVIGGFVIIAAIIALVNDVTHSYETGAKFTFGIEGQMICSGLVARSQERTHAIFNRTPSHVMPADLAKYYQVDPPESSAPQKTM